jgi:hypothetical protein
MLTFSSDPVVMLFLRSGVVTLALLPSPGLERILVASPRHLLESSHSLKVSCDLLLAALVPAVSSLDWVLEGPLLPAEIDIPPGTSKSVGRTGDPM